MIGTIVWLIGLVCAIWCVLDIFKKNISTGGKVIAAVVVLLTSWVGLAVYYFYGRRTCPGPETASVASSPDISFSASTRLQIGRAHV